MTSYSGKSPLSRKVRVDGLPKAGRTVRIEADAGQRSQLAQDHGLENVYSFEADLTLVRWRGDGIRLSGRVSADIVQHCVVTLEPLNATIEEDVELLFVPQKSLLAAGLGEREQVFNVDDTDRPEVFSGNSIDVGAIAEEFFALAIDPYPRSADAADNPVETVEEKTGNRPFSELGKLIGKT